ncbi:MAG: hypothetical protein AB7I30_18425 [Isosphaeraceae bacterium]
MRRRRWISLALAVPLIRLAAGCGASDEFGTRYAVHGTVTLDDKPLETGNVVFIPLNDGPAVQGVINDGSYSISRSEGPTAGTYRVEIHSVQSTGEKVFDQGEGELIEQTRELVPSIYNAKSTLQAEVKADGPTQFDFQLKSPPPAPGRGAASSRPESR